MASGELAPARRLRAAVPSIRHAGHHRPEVGLSGLDAVRKAAKSGRSIKNQLRSVERLLKKVRTEKRRAEEAQRATGARKEAGARGARRGRRGGREGVGGRGSRLFGLGRPATSRNARTPPTALTMRRGAFVLSTAARRAAPPSRRLAPSPFPRLCSDSLSDSLSFPPLAFHPPPPPVVQPDLPFDVRRSAERRLEELRSAEDGKSRRERERKLAQRSHKARFFERVKIERVVKRCEKEVKDAERRLQQVQGAEAEGAEEAAPDAEDAAPGAEEERALLAAALASARERLAAAEEDLSYVVNFPPGEVYVPLLRDPEGSEENRRRVLAERQRLRKLVRDRLAETALITEGDEGRAKAARADAGRAKAAKADAERNASAVPAAAKQGKMAVATGAGEAPAASEDKAAQASPSASASEDEDDFFLPDDAEGVDASSATSFQAEGGVVDFEEIQRQAAEEARAKRRARLGKDKVGLGAASEGELKAWDEEESGDEEEGEEGDATDQGGKPARGGSARTAPARQPAKQGKGRRDAPAFGGKDRQRGDRQAAGGAHKKRDEWNDAPQKRPFSKPGFDRAEGGGRFGGKQLRGAPRDGRPSFGGSAKAQPPRKALGPKGGVAKKAGGHDKAPLRTRAEGGRKRRSKKKE